MLNKNHEFDIVDGEFKKTRQEVIAPDHTCENCGTVGHEWDMINVMIVIGVLGIRGVRGFQCPDVEHWACSLDCWRAVAHACVEEHMVEYLNDIHNAHPESIHNETAQQKVRARDVQA